MNSSTARDASKSPDRRFGPVVWLVPALLCVVAYFFLTGPIWPVQAPTGEVPITGDFIDLQVYRLGVEALRDGGNMYGELPKTNAGISLPFIYPPFAALVLGPFALLPWDPAAFLFFASSVAALAVTLYLVARRVWPERAQLRTALYATACAAPLSMLLEPIWATLNFGQVNLLLMVLVTADVLALRPKWRRGILIGLAAAIKLTPAAFVLYFLVKKDYRSAITAAVTGAVATLLSFAILPKASVEYWFNGMGNVSGLSGSSFQTNQSIQALLARFGIEKPLFTIAWLVLSALLLVLVVAAMRRTLDFPPLALAINAVFTLLVSPISWSHHWVMIAPALFAMFGYALRFPWPRRLRWFAVTAITAWVFVYGPQNWLPGDDDRELSWTPGQHLVGDTYVWLSVLLVALFLVATRRSARILGDVEPAELQPIR
ncbi:glycosyltransferase 87 family protein [Nocardia goodfellowii]|uniref:Alpha-1,2-mannosyltransferase n=1 Tax=Nocardia goodfellowii TaxID=882446 RepID=A0ABS4QEQ5_9NOCA|nr:glycosyltransferase 87 family protein [Nocardia goodfellowii]MBP2189620.1 alpha-1,2-mannosyltransferase [Nocardia goodfellowii]